MVGFFDYLRMVMGWWSAPPIAPPASGPFCFEAVTVFAGGAEESSIFLAGAEEVQVNCQ